MQLLCSLAHTKLNYRGQCETLLSVHIVLCVMNTSKTTQIASQPSTFLTTPYDKIIKQMMATYYCVSEILMQEICKIP